MNKNWQDFSKSQSLAQFSETESRLQLIDLSSLGLLKVSGEDNKKFLQGQLTCDVEAITENRSCLGTYCNLKGRAISSFRLFQRGADIYLLMDKALLEKTKSALQKYIVFSKADMFIVDDTAEDLGCFALAGKDLKAALEPLISDQSSAGLALEPNTSIPLGELTLIQHHENSSLFIGPSEILIETWHKLSANSQTFSQNQWDLNLIENGMAQITHEASELFIPLELHMQHLGFIDFDKGCYTGQEIIARLHYRGSLKQSAFICTAASDHLPDTNAELIIHEQSGDKVVGHVVNAAFSGKATISFLAIIKHEFSELSNVQLFDFAGPKISISQTPCAITK